MKYIVAAILSLVFITSTFGKATTTGSHYVTVEQLRVRLGPNTKSSVTNTLYEKQKVEVLELKNGWARISRYYDGAVEGKTGEVARWVSAKYLSKQRPIEKQYSKNSSQIEQAIKSSDNYSTYRSSFLKASESLVESRKCTLADFNEMGGWVRSSNHKPKPVFFTYCGGMTTSNRIYLNAKTGKIFR